jgi:hypothetical protein
VLFAFITSWHTRRARSCFLFATSFLVEALDERESGGIECGIARAPLSALRLGDDGRICNLRCGYRCPGCEQVYQTVAAKVKRKNE